MSARASPTTGNGAIRRAAKAIKTSDRNLKLAAECLAIAEAKGKTQRQMAEGVGKSVGWVNRLLQWRRDGYQEEAPFSRLNAECPREPYEDDPRLAREERIREQEEAERRGRRQRHWQGNNERARNKRSAAEHVHADIGESDRETLVRVLGMLGSNSDNEALTAARKAEEVRLRLQLTWDELIVAGVADERREAA